MMVLIRSRLRGLEERALLRSVGRSGLAAAVMAAVLLLWRRGTMGQAAWLRGGVGILLGVGGYLAAATLLGAEELRTAVRLILRRRGLRRSG